MWTDNPIYKEDLESIVNSQVNWESFRNSKIMVTGATGLIGSCLVNGLLYVNKSLGLNAKIIGLVRNLDKANKMFEKQLNEDIGLEFIKGDVLEPINCLEDIDYILHCAGVCTSKMYVEKPVETIQISIQGTTNLLELAKSKEVKGFVYVSSMEAFGLVDSQEKVTEEQLGYIDILNIRSSYSESKRLCETLCASYAKEYGVHVKIARLAQTSGAGVSKDDVRAIASFINNALDGKDIILRSKGTTITNGIYTADAVTGLCTLLLKGEDGQAYTVTNEDCCMSVLEIAQTIAKTIGKDQIKVVIDIPEDVAKYGYAKPTTMKLSNQKMRDLGWQPKTRFEELFIRLAKSWQND